MQSMLHWTWNRLKSDRVGVSVFHPQTRVLFFFFRFRFAGWIFVKIAHRSFRCVYAMLILYCCLWFIYVLLLMVAGSLQTMSITLTAPLLFSKLMIVLIYVPSVQICRAYVDERVESGFFLGFWKLCFSTWSIWI